MGWVALRTNEVVLHYSTRFDDDATFAASHQDVLSRRRPSEALTDGVPLFTDAYARVNLTWLKRFQMESMYTRISPQARMREYLAANALIESTHFLDWGNSVLALVIRRTMLPDAFTRTGATTPSVRSLLEEGLGPLFGLAGYEPDGGPTEPSVLAVRRTSYPLARFFHVAMAGAVHARRAPPRPAGCLKLIRPFVFAPDADACTLFLDLALPDGRRMAVYAANVRDFGTSRRRLHARSGSSVAPRVLHLPLDAVLLDVGSPIMGASGRQVPSESLLVAAGHVCAQLGERTLAAEMSAWWRQLSETSPGTFSPRHHAQLGRRLNLPFANRTWHSQMRYLPRYDADPASSIFGYATGMPAVGIDAICRGAALRSSPEGRTTPSLCVAPEPAPPEAGPDQFICCSLQRCSTTDAFELEPLDD
jgi:hypothetical protein